MFNKSFDFLFKFNFIVENGMSLQIAAGYRIIQQEWHKTKMPSFPVPFTERGLALLGPGCNKAYRGIDGRVKETLEANTPPFSVCEDFNFRFDSKKVALPVPCPDSASSEDVNFSYE